MPFDVNFKDNSDLVLYYLQKQRDAALEAVGLAAEAHAVEAAPVGTPESTGIQNYHGGSLRKSLTHKVVDNTVYVGTNMAVRINGKRVSYPIFVELGTGIYATDGNGRKSPWIWTDKNGKKHFTRGMKARHFLRNALSSQKHIAEYKKIYKMYLKNT